MRWIEILALVCILSGGVKTQDAGATFGERSYDYIIVGGGLAGLVVAGRLSINPNISVAVIEAGDTGYSEPTRFLTPAANLYESSVGTRFSWTFATDAQPFLANRSVNWPRGKVLGGSSAINGLYYARHSEREQDTWSALNGNADRWGWDSMLNAMKKSETFTPPSTILAADLTSEAEYALNNTQAHGTTGPLHVSYTSMTYPLITAFFSTIASLGAPIASNPDDGQTRGAYLATSNIDPGSGTRSFSRTAYLDPLSNLPNLHVLTNYTVTRVLFSSDGEQVVATGVQYADSSGMGGVYTANATREVILCGGAINSPQLLQLSGVGEASLLESLNIDVNVELDGVGYHLQDHVVGAVHFAPSNFTTIPPNRLTGNRTLDSFVNSAVAYVPGRTIFQEEWSDIVASMRANISNAIATLYSTAPASVQDGYRATATAQIDTLLAEDVPAVEFLFSLSFGQVHMMAAIQHPLSRGRIAITSNDPFASPSIDPQYLALDVDQNILQRALEFVYTISTTSPLSALLASTLTAQPVTDADWRDWISNSVGTEYHPGSTCAMLPRNLGGVVDPQLRVYGTTNLRVIDASVPPIPLAAHSMSLVYGLAEIGAELILDDYQRFITPTVIIDTNTATVLHHSTLSLITIACIVVSLAMVD